MFYNIDDFSKGVVDFDFQRTNRFSLIFASNPTNSTGNILQQLTGRGTLFNGAPLGMNLMGDNMFNDLVNHSISYGINKVMNKTGLRKIFIGAMNNRLVESILGQFPVGEAFLSFFNVDLMDKGLWVETVTPPAHTLAYGMDTSYKEPSIIVTGREYEPLIVKFRGDNMMKNYQAFVEWNHAIKDPKTGLVAFQDEINADIQVNIHDRNGLPHTTMVFSGCVPVSVKESQAYDYESNDMIQTFDVTFAYRSCISGPVTKEKALEWLASRGIDSIIGKAGLSVIDSEWLHAGQQTFNIFGRY